MTGIFLGILIVYLAFGLGFKALKLLRVQAEPAEIVVFSIGLGLGLAAYGVLFLGLIHRLNANWLWWLAAALAISGLWGRRAAWSALREGIASLKIERSPFHALIGVAAGVTGLAVLAGVLSPETANDSLCYHLHLPKRFLAGGFIGPLPYEINSLFPFLMEMLYTLGLALQGVACAKFFHFAAGLLGALTVLVMARRQAGAQAGWCAAVLFFTTPGIVNQMGTTYVDAGFACFTALALAAFLRWQENRDLPWLILSGIFLGFSLSIKYLAVISALALALWMVWALVRAKTAPKTIAACLAVFAAAAFVFCGYWYVRSWIHFGNPVYPYFYQVFKSGDPTITYDDIGVPKTLAALAMVPWTATMHPERFDGFGSQLGPAYLAFLPLVLLLLRRPGPARGMFYFVLFYFVCWFFLGQSLRFFYPALPALAVLTGAAISRTSEKGWAGKALQAVFIFVLLIHAGLAVYHYRKAYAAAVGLEPPDRYLSRTERNYGMVKYVNENIFPPAKILADDESHLFYFDRPVVRETMYSRWGGYEREAGSPAGVLDRLRRDGFTHVLFLESPGMADPSGLAPLRIRRLIAGGENDLVRGLSLLYSTRFLSVDGEDRRYALYEILPQKGQDENRAD